MTAREIRYLSKWACPPYLTMQQIADGEPHFRTGKVGITKHAVCQTIQFANRKLVRAGLPELRPPRHTHGRTVPMDPAMMVQLSQRRSGRFSFLHTDHQADDE